MELIIGFGLGVLGIIAAAASRQLADEFKAWTPWIIERLVKHAVRTLPEAWRDRFEEEWLSHIRETPGEVGKIMAAFGFLFAARQMSSPIIFPKRCLDVVAALATLFVVAPLSFLSRRQLNSKTAARSSPPERQNVRTAGEVLHSWSFAPLRLLPREGTLASGGSFGRVISICFRS